MTDMQFIGTGLYDTKDNILILGDLHIGSDEHLSQSGAFSPVIGLTEIKESIEYILSQVKPTKIILLGDLAVSFKPLTYIETSEIRKVLEFLKKHCENIILIKGNHDMFIEKLISSMKIPFVEKHEEEDYACVHGDKIIPTKKKTIIIGHEHPAIAITNDIRTEKFKCFIKTTFEDKKLFVLPSVNKLHIGTNILNEKLLSPYLTENTMSNASIFVLENNAILPFGKLKDF